MKFPKILLLITSSGLSLVFSQPLLALANDKDQPIQVEADSADLNEAKGTQTYKGRVKITQGSIKLNADKVTVYYKNKTVDRVVAEGRPTKFRQLKDDRKTEVKAIGRKIDYKMNSELLILTGDAELIQGTDTIKSDRIIYDRVKSVVKGGSAAQGNKRVKITIQAPQ